jgi:hypothetical protein
MHPDSMGFKSPNCDCGVTEWHVDQYRTKVKSAENKLCSCDHVHTKKGRPIKPHRWGCEMCIHREDAVIDAALKGRSTASDNDWLIE